MDETRQRQLVASVSELGKMVVEKAAGSERTSYVIKIPLGNDTKPSPIQASCICTPEAQLLNDKLSCGIYLENQLYSRGGPGLDTEWSSLGQAGN